METLIYNIEICTLFAIISTLIWSISEEIWEHCIIHAAQIKTKDDGEPRSLNAKEMHKLKSYTRLIFYTEITSGLAYFSAISCATGFFWYTIKILTLSGIASNLQLIYYALSLDAFWLLLYIIAENSHSRFWKSLTTKMGKNCSYAVSILMLIAILQLVF